MNYDPFANNEPRVHKILLTEKFFYEDDEEIYPIEIEYLCEFQGFVDEGELYYEPVIRLINLN